MKKIATLFLLHIVRMWDEGEAELIAACSSRKEYKFARTYTVYDIYTFISCLLNDYVPVLGVFE